MPLVLPVGLEDPVARLFAVRYRMNELKGSCTALVSMAVMSNVPGPQQPLHIGDCQLDQCMLWVPQTGDIGVGVSILSYNGGVQFGIVTDDALVQDPDNIIRCFAPEFEKLVLLALMDDWTHPETVS